MVAITTKTGSGSVTRKMSDYRLDNVRIGIVGYGYWGPKLVRNFEESSCANLEIVCDRRQDRLDEVRKLYPHIPTTYDFQSLLNSDCDAVVIATPVHTHYRLAKAALQSGKHVLIEKPLTYRSSEAQELIDLADQMDLTLMVGHTFEYNPAVEAVRDIIQSGEVGQVYYLNATRANLGLLQPDINVMWDLGPHDISILRFILGTDPIRVNARGAVYINTHRRLDEVIYMNLIFKDNIMANLRLSWLDPVKQRRLTIVGSKKMIVYDDIASDKVVIFDKGIEVPPYSVTENEFHASYRHGAETVHPIDWNEPLKVECEHFVECIRSGVEPRSGGDDAIKIIKVLETAQRSLNNGGADLLVEY